MVKYLILWFRIIFNFKKSIFVLCPPLHANLGDQAQFLCLNKWIDQHYSSYTLFYIDSFLPTINFGISTKMIIRMFNMYMTFLVLKVKVKKCDIFIGHSGYYFVDHHSGWKLFVDILKLFPDNIFIIMPQTINFFDPVIKNYLKHTFNKYYNNVMLLCRDNISFAIAGELFPKLKISLYPDIVTTMIDKFDYDITERKGILLCLRNDVESLYSKTELLKLLNNFDESINIVDTDVNMSYRNISRNREIIINDFIKMISKFKLVITDRYHGTIFSLISSTPVVVLDSNDHKLSSGINWFKNSKIENYVFYASNNVDLMKYVSDILSSAFVFEKFKFDNKFMNRYDQLFYDIEAFRV